MKRSRVKHSGIWAPGARLQRSSHVARMPGLWGGLPLDWYRTPPAPRHYPIDPLPNMPCMMIPIEVDPATEPPPDHILRGAHHFTTVPKPRHLGKRGLPHMPPGPMAEANEDLDDFLLKMRAPPQLQLQRRRRGPRRGTRPQPRARRRRPSILSADMATIVDKPKRR